MIQTFTITCASCRLCRRISRRRNKRLRVCVLEARPLLHWRLVPVRHALEAVELELELKLELMQNPNGTEANAAGRSERACVARVKT
jgi:hypothetical protein